MSLNFKLLKRSFSLRNNVTDDKEDKNVSIYSHKLNSSSNVSPTNRELLLKPFDDISIIDLHTEAFNIEMEYFIPYARLKNLPQSGMQLTTVKRNEQAPSANVTSVVSSNVVVSSKKMQKHVLNQQFNNFKGSEIEFSPTKMSKKQLKVAQDQLKKLTKINIHLSALFAAVENGQTDRAKSILESTDVNVNCTNSDALSPLDVAVLSNNRSLTKILLEYGASHGARFKTCESMGYHLNTLLDDALNKINDYTCGSHDDLGDEDADKQIDFWQKRANCLQRILRGWVQSTAPNLPNSVVVDVTSSTSVAVKVQESLTGAITTKFKIQWSLTEDFEDIIDEREINDLTNSQGVMFSTFHLYNLCHGQRYYFRALSGNIKGWSDYCISRPRCVIPSSWQDIAIKVSTVNKKVLDDLMAKLSAIRMTSLEIPLDPSASNGLCIKKKATIKQLFTATSKFQKQLKRGIYLACVLYHDGKVLLTNDDTLPVIEIDENYPNNFCSEFPWLMKVSCNWDIVKALRNEIEKHSSSVSQFRLRLLSAISQMQSAMGLKDLGYFYYRCLQDSQGTVVISCINHIKNPKTISVLNSRWIPLRKIQRKLLPIGDGSNINDIILASIPNQIEFHEVGCTKLAKGLYIGYLQMHCSMEQMHVVVPVKTPHVLPNQKIRDNPHVCAEEWEALQDTFNPNQRTEVQKKFIETISTAAWRLFKYMGRPTECALKHKLYNLELIKLSHDVSFLIVCPPIETSCSLVPGQREMMMLQRPDLVSVPTHAFEMGQLFTYDKETIQKCARLSIIVDVETVEANNSHREAFSAVELEAAKERLDRLQSIKVDMSDYWKSIRWLLDVMTFSRNRCSDTGISMRSILNVDASQTEPAELRQREQLNIPSECVTVPRRSPCRSSWPNNNRRDQAAASLSKSDQQLNFVMSRVSCRQTSDVDCLRRNSADDKYPHCLQTSEEHLNRFAFVDQYSLSKSEETLSTSAPTFSPLLQRKRSKTISARICSSSCSDCRKSSTHTGHSNGSEPLENEISATTCSVSSYLTDEDGKTTKIESNVDSTCDKENVDDNNAPQLGTVQVYFANDGNNGICLQLHITTQTTAREIIDLVISHCNQSVLSIDEKLTSCHQLNSKDFCLFAIFGSRGRCVQDNFRPLQLQNPWKKGRLYVRCNRDIVAEIERSERDVHTI